MKVTVDVKTLLETLQEHNPEANLTGVKAYLFDLAILGTPTNTPLSRQPMIPREHAPSRAWAPPPPVSLDDDPEMDAAAVGTYAEELSPFAPAQPLTGESLEDDDGDAPPEDPALRALARQVVGESTPARREGGRVVVNSTTTTQTGPPVRRSLKDRQAEKLAKRKEMDDYSKLSGKELLAKLADTQTVKKPHGSNQFTNVGQEGPSGGGGDMDVG